MSGLRFGLVLLLTLCAAAAHGEDEVVVPRKADPALDAWRTHRSATNEAAARRIASSPYLDPVEVGSRMVLDAEAPKPLLAELRAWREDAPAHAGLPGLDVLIGRIEQGGQSEIEREQRLTEAATRMASASDPAEGDAILVERADDLATKDSHAAWRLLHLRSRVYRRAGATDQVIAALDRAARYARDASFRVRSARSLYAGAVEASRAGDTQGGIERARASLRAAKASGEPYGIRQGVVIVASLLFRAGRLPEALAALEATPPSETWDVRDRHVLYRVAFNVQSRGNRPMMAKTTAERMLANVEGHGGTSEAEALRSLGVAHAALGEATQALACFERALTFDLSRAPRLERLVHAGLAALWIQLGRHEDAETHARAAVALSRKTKRRDDEAQDLLMLSQTLAGRERLDEALKHATKALATAVRDGDAERAGEARRHMATLLWSRGSQEQALHLLLDVRRSASARGDTVAEAYAVFLMGAYRMQRGEAAKALSMADRGVALLHPAHELQGRFARLRSASLLGLGRHAESLAAARVALEHRRRALQGLAEGDTRAPQRHLAEAASYGLGAAVALKDAEAAFELIEASRAMQLNIALRAVRSQALAALPEDLVADEQRTRRAIATARTELVRAAQGAAPRADLERIEQTLDDAWRERDRVVAALERASRRAAVAVGAKRVTIERLRTLLGPDEAWVAFHEAGSRLVALGVRREGLVLKDLGPREPIERRIASWRRALGTPGASDQALARTLHDQLLAPLSTFLEDVGRLIVAPSGALAAVPLAAVMRPDETRLVRRVEVLYVPSATSYAILAGSDDQPGAGLVVVAAPDYAGTGLPPLPHAEDEADQVAKAFPDAPQTRLGGKAAKLDALESALTSHGPRLRALHVAAHAFVDPAHPERTGIALSEGRMWTADFVKRAKVLADLVVLSCCDSARGTQAEGEGQRGLVRAFLIAGARRVVASCWRVSDKHTPALMGRLYALWEGEGRDLPTALRTAQLERIDKGGPLAHPYHWASFVAWGPP